MSDNIFTNEAGGYVASALGIACLAGIVACQMGENFSDEKGVEHFGNQHEMPQRQYNQPRERFYDPHQHANSYQTPSIYRGPQGQKPMGQQNVNLNTSGDQLLSYKIYQQAVNAATPTKQQLDAISGQSQNQTGMGARNLGGGLSEKTAPYDILSGGLYDSEYQAVNLGSERAQNISACAQNAPTFVATSLLPKPNVPGQQTWDVNAPCNVLSNQNFLAATQQIGTDTVLSSLRNPSFDIRNNIPNPINVVSPWLNTTITPELERRPLDCFIPEGGLYGCSGAGGCNTNPTFVGK